MRWLRCSYDDLLALPEGYVAVAVDMARREAAEARARRRSRSA
jgi:hypothetical protein